MVFEMKNGRIVFNMNVTIKKVKKKEKEEWNGMTEISLKEIGKITKEQVMENSFGKMADNI